MEKLTRQQQSEQTYKRFIEKITDIIVKGEIDKMTIRSLCGSLGLSPRTFYLYFENKEQAILKCYGYYEQELHDEIRRSQEDAEDPLERVMQIFHAKMLVSLKAAKVGRELYISALHYYDESLFSDSLPLYQEVKMALDECSDECRFTEETRDIAWELIDFSRGIVFDYFLRKESYDLLEVADRKMRRYFSTFFEKYNCERK